MRTGPIVCGKGLVTEISAVLYGVPTALIFSMRSFIRLNGCGERLVTEISEVLFGVPTALIFSRDLLLDWLGFHVNVSCELRKEEKWLMCKSNKWNQFTCLSCSRMLNDTVDGTFDGPERMFDSWLEVFSTPGHITAVFYDY